MEQPKVSIQELLHDLNNDTPREIILGRKTYTVKYLKDKTAELVSYESLKFSDGIPSSINDAMDMTIKEKGVMARCVAYLLLNSYWKIKLFHRIYAKYLSWTMTRRELVAGIIHSQIAMDLEVFSLGITYTSQMNTLRMKMDQKEVEQSIVEQK